MNRVRVSFKFAKEFKSLKIVTAVKIMFTIQQNHTAIWADIRGQKYICVIKITKNYTGYNM